MRVLHLSAGSLRRGASRGALWLHHGLRAQGIDSQFLTTDRKVTVPGVQSVAPGPFGALLLRGLKQLDRLPLRAYRFDRRGTLSPGWIGLLRPGPGPIPPGAATGVNSGSCAKLRSPSWASPPG
jgi:hypothetical protein